MIYESTVTEKSAQAASEVEPVSQMYINKLKVKGWDKRKKTVVNKFKQTPSKKWMYAANPAKSKKFAQHLKIRKLEMPSQQENSLIKQLTSPKFLPVNNPDTNLSPDMEIVKITTVIEAIRQKRQRNANTLEETKDIEKIIGKKRSKRSSRESDYSEDARRAREEILSIMNKRSRYHRKRHHQNPRKEASPTRKRASDDLKVENTIPSTVFYKRIWEYINGTRPHSDITSGYDSSREYSEKENSTCTDRDRITASQSRVNELRATSPEIKPEQELYKHIWDIINATKLTHGGPRSKRNTDTRKSDAFTTSAQCAREGKANPEENRQTTNERAALDITDTIDSREVSDPGSYVSNFWIVANKTQWQPERIAPVNIVQLNSILSPNVNVASASEVDDLNKIPDKVQSNADYSASTDYLNETHNRSQEITEPGPPYSPKKEDSTVSSFSSTVETPRTANSESYSTTPIYDPSNIPYVEVPDYSDKRENSLDKNNQSSTTEKYKEYDDNDYVDPEQLRNIEQFSSNSPSIGSEVEHNIQATNDESATPLNVSQSDCVENKDSAECIERYNAEDTKLNNNTKDDTSGVVQHSSGDSAESVERENFTAEFVPFDINEYRKPFEFDFIDNDPIFKSLRAASSEETQEETQEDTKHEKEANSNNSGESKEYKEYATYPKEKDIEHNNEGNSNDTDKSRETYPREKYTKYDKHDEKIPNYKEESEEYKKYFKYPKEKDTKRDNEENSNDTEKSEEYKAYATYPKEDTKHDSAENPDHSEKSEEYETYATYGKEKNTTNDNEENPTDNEKSEEYEAYGTYPKEKNSDEKNLEHSGKSEEYETSAYPKEEELSGYSAKNKDYHDNYYPISDEKDETKEKTYVEEGEKNSEISDKDQYDAKDFFKHIFGEDRNKASSDIIDTEREFLSRYFTEDVLRKMRENSTAEEDRQEEESKNREEIHKTLSEILDKKDRYSRLDEDLNKMIEKGQTIPIRYNNYWSLEYQSPKNIEKKEKEEEREEA